MDAKTLAALKASIEHWRENEALPPEKVRIGVGSCALCAEFWRLGCKGCPLDAVEDKCSHKNSTYENARLAKFDNNHDWPAAARAMREKLESLLPVEADPALDMAALIDTVLSKGAE